MFIKYFPTTGLKTFQIYGIQKTSVNNLTSIEAISTF